MSSLNKKMSDIDFILKIESELNQKIRRVRSIKKERSTSLLTGFKTDANEHITELVLQSCRIKNIQLKMFSYLSFLDLSSNEILNTSAFKNLKRLTTLFFIIQSD